jgi:hypothetical protein
MVYDDHFAEGLAYLFLLIGLLLTVFPAIELAALNAILKRTANRYIHFGIPAIILLFGYLLIMQINVVNFVVIISLVLVSPVAVIITPYVFSGLKNQKGRFWRSLFVYIAVFLFGIVILYGISVSGVFKNPIFSLYPPFSNAVIYGAIFILETVFTYYFYKIIVSLFLQD